MPGEKPEQGTVEGSTGVTAPLIVLGCGKHKRPHAAPAIDLYTGTFTRAQADWARSVTTQDRIVIFSARYGLVRADQVIEPYDVTLTGPPATSLADRVDDATLAAQADALDMDGVTITLAGLAYRRRLLRATRGRVIPVHPFVEQARAQGHVPGIGTLRRAVAASHGHIPPYPPTGDSRLWWNADAEQVWSA